jgi:predicted CoA-substrate-specific enzyme activase
MVSNLVAGIDIGARNTSAVIIQDGQALAYCVLTSGENGATVSRQAISETLQKAGRSASEVKCTVATGCGRNSAVFAVRVSTEVVCQAKGAFHLFTMARTVINLGAESNRAIRLADDGRVTAFAKNDKCAAGSGLFLETMSTVLDVPLESMGDLSLKSDGYEEVSSICAVFAESEVISHIHRGIPKERILAGLHKAVADRILEMTGPVGIKAAVVVTGGVAKNRAIIKELENKIGLEVLVPPEPQITGALGAALLAREIAGKE